MQNFGVKFELNSFYTNNDVSLIRSDAIVALERFEQKFDLILIDPPYKSEYYEKALEVIFKNNLLADDGIIVMEHDKDRTIETNKFEIISQKNYGRRNLTYLTNKN